MGLTLRKKKKVVKEKISVFDEIRGLVKKAKPFHIVKGKAYLYFCVQPTQETIVFQQILKKRNLSVAAVYNYKDNIIGYLVEFPNQKPHLDISKGAEGAAIFFSDKLDHRKPKVVFADQKLRILNFGQDYFISVKWKSNQGGEDF